MSDAVTQCPTCGSAATLSQGDGDAIASYHATLTREQIALALDNEVTCLAIAAVMPPDLRLAIASVMLQSGGGEPFFTPDDVREEAEAAARCDGVVKQLRARRQFDEAAVWSGMAEKHRKRAKRIMLLLSNAEQQLLQEQIHSGPLADPPHSTIEVVKS